MAQWQLSAMVILALLALAHGCEDWEDALQLHNEYRKDHGSPPLKWSKAAAKSAQDWAEQIVENCVGGHSDYGSRGGDYGENVLWGAGWFKTDLCVLATNGWYSESKGYKCTKTPFSDNDWEKHGHFTMMIWADSGEVGCAGAAKKDSVGGKPCSAVVCHYHVPGNQASNAAFAANVGCAKGSSKKRSVGSRRMMELPAAWSQFSMSVSPPRNWLPQE